MENLESIVSKQLLTSWQRGHYLYKKFFMRANPYRHPILFKEIFTRTRPLENFLMFLRAFLKAIWLFFPSILFLVLALFATWYLTQGKRYHAKNVGTAKDLLHVCYCNNILGIHHLVYKSHHWKNNLCIAFKKAR